MLVDAHCHLDAPQLGDSAARFRLLEAAYQAGVGTVVVAGTGPGEWEGLRGVLREASSSRVEVLGCFGIHPQVVPDLDDHHLARALERLETLAPHGVAIGECGLDGPSTQLPGGALERQSEVLLAHLRLAGRMGLPVVIHCLRTHEALLRLLRKVGVPPKGILLHSYSGSAEQVREYLELGCAFSFAAPVGYPNARRPVLAARAVPADRLLVETDAPYQLPHSHREPGALNMPAYLPAVVESLARARGTSSEALGRLTSENARRLLSLSPSSRKGEGDGRDVGKSDVADRAHA